MLGGRKLVIAILVALCGCSGEEPTSVGLHDGTGTGSGSGSGGSTTCLSTCPSLANGNSCADWCNLANQICQSDVSAVIQKGLAAKEAATWWGELEIAVVSAVDACYEGTVRAAEWATHWVIEAGSELLGDHYISPGVCNNVNVDPVLQNIGNNKCAQWYQDCINTCDTTGTPDWVGKKGVYLNNFMTDCPPAACF